MQTFYCVATFDPSTKVILSGDDRATEAEAQALVARYETMFPNPFYYETDGFDTDSFLVDDSTSPPTAYPNQVFRDSITRDNIRIECYRRLDDTFPEREKSLDRSRIVALLMRARINSGSYTTEDQAKADIVEPKIAWIDSTIERADFLSLPENLPTGPVDDDALWPAPFVVAMQEPLVPPEEDGQGEQDNS